MTKEKKECSRRSFLKGAITAGIIAGAPGTGLFIKEAGAQTQLPARQPRLEPPNVTQDDDIIPTAQNVLEAAINGAYDSYETALEKFVKSSEKSMDVANALNLAGLRLQTREARGAAKKFAAPPSVIKLREHQLKQKGWHSNATWTIKVGCNWMVPACIEVRDMHTHVTW
jgi:hypothetical protein